MSLNTDKLAKCLALLTSDQDGEVLAAARAVVRFLAEGGKRPEDLAAQDCRAPLADALDAITEVRIQQEAAIRAVGIAERLAEHERARAAALAERVEVLEDRVEELSPPLDWAEIAGRYNRRHRADALECRALTGKLTLQDRRTLRAFAAKGGKRGKAGRAEAHP